MADSMPTEPSGAAPTPHYADNRVTLHHGDCLDILAELPGASVDAVVTDPPYGLEFMGKEWDGANGFRRSLNPNDVGRDNPFGRSSRTSPEYRAGALFQEWCEAWARECFRVLKPGGHILAFGGTRTWHRLTCAIEDSGFEIRDSIAWMYGSGFPKSLDVSKAIDKAAGAEREVVGNKLDRPDYHLNGHDSGTGAFGKGISATTAETRLAAAQITAPATDAARTWQGWGTALKPAFEPVVVARKPLSGTVAANVLAHGTGALNIDGCRVGTDDDLSRASGGWQPDGYVGGTSQQYDNAANVSPAGRWPANVVLDESQAAALDEQSGTLTSGLFRPEHADNGKDAGTYGAIGGREREAATYGDTGGASRFFYVAKADASERVRVNGTAHPTVKPLSLMRWLVRLVTPPGGTVLEPFAGSGTTVEACILEGFDCIAIEREADYLPLIRQRINRRRDPVQAVKATGEDGGLFDLLGEATA